MAQLFLHRGVGHCDGLLAPSFQKDLRLQKYFMLKIHRITYIAELRCPKWEDCLPGVNMMQVADLPIVRRRNKMFTFYLTNNSIL
jgi:hypothetical protein